MKLRPQVSARSPSAPCGSQVSVLLTAAVMAAVAASAAAQRQFEELGKRGLPAGRASTRSTVLGDVDRDGDLDLVVGNWYQQSRLYLNNGTGTFTDATATRMPVGNHPTSSLALGDVDRDGDLELVLGNYYQQDLLYLNNGTGTFTDATASRMPIASDYTTSLALGDVDRDGDFDLVVGNQGQQSRLYLNHGTGTFADATASRIPVGVLNTYPLALGDVDGDGDLDLVVGNWQQQNCLYLNHGTGVFSDATPSRMPVGNYPTTSLALGDVDLDGDLDLVVGLRWGGSLLYLNNGTGTFTNATASRMPVSNANASSLALGDVDGDGDPDLVVGNRWGQILLYLNSGTGTFTDATTSRMPVGNYATTSLALGDVDGDGDLDLVVGNGGLSGSQSRLYLNTGTGTFTDATASRMPVGNYGTTSLALGDVDRDGDLDMVLGNGSILGRQSRLFLNLLRQLDAPYVLHIGRNYQLDVYSRYGPTTTTETAFPVLSTGTANIAFPPFGTIGIDLNHAIALPPFVVPQPAGIGSLIIPVPNLSALVGTTIYTQTVLNQQPVQVRLTNVIGDIILR